MNRKMSSIIKLTEAISDLLIGKWDPIGIQTEVNAQDEYDSIALEIASLTIQGGSTVEISEMLSHKEIEMGLQPADRSQLAKRIMQLKDVIC